MENHEIPKLNINVNFEKKNHQILINYLIKVGELKQIIFTHFQVDTMNYCLYYKNAKLQFEDNRPLSLFFYNDKKPLLFLIDKKTIFPFKKPSTKITIFSNLKEEKILKQLIQFFQLKNIPFNAKVDNSINGIYNIHFKNKRIAEDFKFFFEQKKKSYSNLTTSRKKNYVKKSLSTDNINRNYEIRKINKIKLPKIKNNPKDKTDYSFIKKTKDNYQGMYLFPYMSAEEKYLKEAYEDKVNWICKQNFIVSVVHYKMKDNFIKNYVSATPSEPPLCHKFREVNKNKWINKKGFFL